MTTNNFDVWNRSTKVVVAVPTMESRTLCNAILEGMYNLEIPNTIEFVAHSTEESAWALNAFAEFKEATYDEPSRLIHSNGRVPSESINMWCSSIVYGERKRYDNLVTFCQFIWQTYKMDSGFALAEFADINKFNDGYEMEEDKANMHLNLTINIERLSRRVFPDGHRLYEDNPELYNYDLELVWAWPWNKSVWADPLTPELRVLQGKMYWKNRPRKFKARW